MVIYNQFRQNLYLLIGISIGLCLALIFTPYLENGCFLTLGNTLLDTDDTGDYEPRINLEAKPLKAQRSPQKLLRPRYFSTELGIREKLFVAVLTTQETIDSKAISINKTVAHLVDKLMFFIDAPGSQKLNVSYLKLPGIVGFVDTRSLLKPFHVLKYIKDNYIENYDFFFIIKDATYLKARKLYEIVQTISVSQDVYASTIYQDSLFCSLDAGILFSNSVIQKMVKNIDWCVNNAFSLSDEDNFGRCVLHSTNKPCEQYVQGNHFTSFRIQNEDKLDVEFHNMTNDPEFEKALTLYPVNSSKTFYQLHFYFTKVALYSTKLEISSLRQSVLNMSHLLPNGYNTVTWPIGNQPGNKPNTRFDVLRWDYFNENYIYLDTDFSNIRPLNRPEKQDIQNVLNASIEMVESKYEDSLRYRYMLNGYRRFDPSRGMDYKLDLVFHEISTGKFIRKRIEVCKPLGKVEILAVPYVTENRRVNILLPVSIKDKNAVNNFLRQYRNVCLEKKDKTFLMLVLLYEYNAPGKGTKDDIFKDLKHEAQILTKMFQKDDNRVAWVSIKLPLASVPTIQQAFLDFAFIDLAVKKFSPESLILIARPNMEIRMDYLNRVRMNTIHSCQVYSPVPFSEYNPLIVYNAKNPRLKYLEINKNFGHYDNFNTRHISFYVKDYLTARKNVRHIIPTIMTDLDIKYISQSFNKNEALDGNVTSVMLNTVYSMFVRFGDVHVIRAVEPALRLRYEENDCEQHRFITDPITANLYKHCVDQRNFNLGSRSQLAKLILDYQLIQQTSAV